MGVEVEVGVEVGMEVGVGRSEVGVGWGGVGRVAWRGVVGMMRCGVGAVWGGDSMKVGGVGWGGAGVGVGVRLGGGKVGWGGDMPICCNLLHEELVEVEQK